MTASKDWKTVWILGSGFSKPLGGPTLPQLLSHTAFEDAAARYPKIFQGEAQADAHAVRYAYHYGTRFAQGVPKDQAELKGEPLWDHAEEFMEQLDAAALDANGPIAKKILWIANSRFDKVPPFEACYSISALRSAARRVVAIQCTTFALAEDIGSEKWRPFKDWVAALDERDTIITFNYDPVLERLNQNLGRLRFVAPNQGPRRHGEEHLAEVYKLHGSVTWKREEDKDGVKIVALSDLEHAATCDPNELAIATPGRSKHTDVGELFQPLWKKAARAIAEANAVVFIGYRFPPSDAYARERLLRALWKNPNPALRTFIVLGPNVSSPDVIRLKRMVDWTVASSNAPRSGYPYETEVEPLYSEDYLTTWRLDAATRQQRGEPPDEE